MSALPLASETFQGPITNEFLEAVAEKFSGMDFTVDDLRRDSTLMPLLSTKKKPKKSAKKVTAKQETPKGVYDCCKCDARVWTNGLGGQCTRKKVEGELVCTMHGSKISEAGGEWWLGMVTEPRPEEPIHQNGKPHQWKNDGDFEDSPEPEKVKEKKNSPKKKKSPEKVEKKKKSPKKKESPEKVKEKNGAKKSPEKGGKKSPKKKKSPEKAKNQDVSADDVKMMLSRSNGKTKKEDEEDDLPEGGGTGVNFLDSDEEQQAVDELDNDDSDVEGDEDGFVKIVFEGVEYLMDKDDKEVIVPDDYTVIGIWDSDSATVEFNDEGEDIHKARVEGL